MEHRPLTTVFPKQGSMADAMNAFIEAVTYYGTRKTMVEVGEKFRHEVNRYIPAKTYNLQRYSYNLTTGRDPKKGPWFKLEYLNTEKVPYALYQYYGEVWGPNYATWRADITLHKDPENTKIDKWTHTGWVSAKGKKKRPMGYPIGIKRTFVMKNGKILTITGYTKRGKKALWLEYFRNSPRYEPWLHSTVRPIIAEITRKYNAKRSRG